MGSGTLALLLALATVMGASPAGRQCELSGLWRNNLESLMEISAVRDDGSFQGKYLTRVSLAGGCVRVSPLTGAQQDLGELAWPTFGFTVRWERFSNATAVFVGQCFVDAGGQETLATTWLLREAVGSWEDNWKATRVGRNVFRRDHDQEGKSLQSWSPSCEDGP
ncbi:avidin-related protein 2-like [Rhea pennata]|uniref:avidin-related protein 2-like n=1 Tax=Rhea pennata TaxID=8795 RepID=UPI002E273266